MQKGKEFEKVAREQQSTILSSKGEQERVSRLNSALSEQVVSTLCTFFLRCVCVCVCVSVRVREDRFSKCVCVCHCICIPLRVSWHVWIGSYLFLRVHVRVCVFQCVQIKSNPCIFQIHHKHTHRNTCKILEYWSLVHLRWKWTVTGMQDAHRKV